MLTAVETHEAPQAIGPYVQAINVDGLIHTSGQIGLMPDGKMAGGDVKTQTHQVLTNLRRVLEAGGARMDDVIKTTIFLTDMNDFAAVNEIYAHHFGRHKPARSTVEVSRLPKDARIEIECIARPRTD